ncbi:MAG: coproporphyrinogen dehydrogenase HemZ [Clostridiales bacterium]|nr:coproporphyrinogen dehydrogenase HemZ [Clostridiales bacterium]
MLKVILKGHESFYGISDILRMFFGEISEDRDNGFVSAADAPDMTLINSLEDNGRSVTEVLGSEKLYAFDGDVLEPGREVKRSLYIALADLTGTTLPWGCLSGIRPTLVASEEDSPEDLTKKYLVREDKAALGFETSREEMRLLELVPHDDLNIYVGVPFCPSRCSYCSFISQDISHHMGRLGEYEAALENEIRSIAPYIDRRISTLYMGGGTPTVFSDEQFAKLLDCIYSNIKIDPRCEVTIEAGRPDTITEYKLDAMRSHGIGRICINPQTMRNETLSKLGRLHTSEDVVKTYEEARERGFEVINMDLIAGLPHETGDDFVDSVSKLIKLDPGNITIHTLYKKRRAALSKETVLDRDETRGDIDAAVSEGYRLLYDAGYHPYYLYRQKDTGHGLENTGFAKGDTGCLYNVAMMSDARDILSFGAGGMSKRCFEQAGSLSKHRVERCPTVKDVLTYIRGSIEAAERKRAFFGL